MVQGSVLVALAVVDIVESQKIHLVCGLPSPAACLWRHVRVHGIISRVVVGSDGMDGRTFVNFEVSVKGVVPLPIEVPLIDFKEVLAIALGIDGVDFPTFP